MKRRLNSIRRAITRKQGRLRLVSWSVVAKEIGISVASVYSYIGGNLPITTNEAKIVDCERRYETHP